MKGQRSFLYSGCCLWYFSVTKDFQRFTRDTALPSLTFIIYSLTKNQPTIVIFKNLTLGLRGNHPLFEEMMQGSLSRALTSVLLMPYAVHGVKTLRI